MKTLTDRVSIKKFKEGVAKARRRLDAEAVLWRAEQRVIKAARSLVRAGVDGDCTCSQCPKYRALSRAVRAYQATIIPKRKGGGKP